MIPEPVFFAFITTMNVGWTAWLQYKSQQLEANLRNICKECEYEYTPRKK